MRRRLLVPEDAKHYRWHLQLDSPFLPPPLHRGFDYEAQIDLILDMIWSPRMTDFIGIDLDRFRRITRVSITKQKRELLDVALTFGPIPSSRSFLYATDTLLQAENTGHHPIDLRPPALRVLPVRVEAMNGIEVWCGAAAAVRSDIALVLADLDLSHRRLRGMSEPTIRAHSIAGPRLQTDCSLVKGFFEADFHAGSVALTRGYFSGARYLVHAVPPRTDDGIWRHTLQDLTRCYEALWSFSSWVKAKRIAVQLITLGSGTGLQQTAQDLLIEQINQFRSAQENPPTVCLVGQTTAAAMSLAAVFRHYRVEERLRGSGGLRPAGNPGERFSPTSLGTKNAV